MILKIILLDGAQALIFIPIFFLLHVITTFLIEGSILYWFKYGSFKRCGRDALIINMGSLVVGLLLMAPLNRLVDKMSESSYNFLILLGMFYIETVIAEGLLLRWLNKTFPVKKLIVATLLMNLLTYITLFFILKYISRSI